MCVLIVSEFTDFTLLNIFTVRRYIYYLIELFYFIFLFLLLTEWFVIIECDLKSQSVI